MNFCQNCGKGNVEESQFCRFCGTLLAVAKAARQQGRADSSDHRRPYSWKTDEYETQTEVRKPINVRQSDVQAYGAQPLAYARPQFVTGSYRCPNCMSQFLPQKERRISTAGWIVFAILLVLFFPLFWVGLLIREDVYSCPSCKTKLK